MKPVPGFDLGGVIVREVMVLCVRERMGIEVVRGDVRRIGRMAWEAPRAPAEYVVLRSIVIWRFVVDGGYSGKYQGGRRSGVRAGIAKESARRNLKLSDESSQALSNSIGCSVERNSLLL